MIFRNEKEADAWLKVWCAAISCPEVSGRDASICADACIGAMRARRPESPALKQANPAEPEPR